MLAAVNQGAQDRKREMEALAAGMVDTNEAVESPESDATASTDISVRTRHTFTVGTVAACDHSRVRLHAVTAQWIRPWWAEGGIMGIIGWIIVGIVAGWLAGVVTRTDRSIWGDLVLGLAGALIAGFVTDGLVGGDSGLTTSIIVAAIFAAILVLVKNFIMNRAKS
jgi:uncharacterized membrane protein YeaQ/YmgE (transglycosylase-associated protein family)